MKFQALCHPYWGQLLKFEGPLTTVHNTLPDANTWSALWCLRYLLPQGKVHKFEVRIADLSGGSGKYQRETRLVGQKTTSVPMIYQRFSYPVNLIIGTTFLRVTGVKSAKMTTSKPTPSPAWFVVCLSLLNDRRTAS